MDLSYITAPMVKCSDAAFRALTRKYGATLAFTQMLHPEKLLDDKDYLDFHIRDLTIDHNVARGRPVVAQLCGNDPDIVTRAAKKISAYCDGIDLNLGCPQTDACTRHYGGYLLGKKDWPLVESIVSALCRSVSVPISTKIRLCQPQELTTALSLRLEHAGSSFLTLHARHVSARRRRHGAADLSAVQQLKTELSIPVISNGNVCCYEDLGSNLAYTGADGLMVGETLLGNPCLFAGVEPDPISISLEYLELCRQFNDTVPIQLVQAHVRRFLQPQCARRPWFSKFRAQLGKCTTLDEISHFLCHKVERWRGRPPRKPHMDGEQDSDRDSESDVTHESTWVGIDIDLALLSMG